MPEYDDYQPADWSAKDTFASARAAYDANAGRGYTDAKTKGVQVSSLVPVGMTSYAMVPIVILCDQTGSMGDWPATIFSKLGYLDHECKFYFGADYELCFGAFGDAQKHEDYPLQIRPFVKEAGLKEELMKLIIEGGGGGNYIESSELGALYVLKNIQVPNAVKPILIIITDEKCYDTITPEDAKHWAKVDLQERMTAKALFDELKTKWATYLVRKPYGSSTNVDNENSTDKMIREHWEQLLDTDHMAYLPDASRVVDVIFGIFAKETGKVDDFRKELEDRQGKDVDGDKKIATVYKALATVHTGADDDQKRLPGNKASMKKLANPDKTQHSQMHNKPDGQSRRAKKLTDD